MRRKPSTFPHLNQLANATAMVGSELQLLYTASSSRYPRICQTLRIQSRPVQGNALHLNTYIHVAEE